MDQPNRTMIETIPDVHMNEVPKEFFFEGMALPVSVFIRLREGHYVMIGKQNDKAAFASLHSFQNPKARVFVKTSDHNLLISYVTDLSSKMMSQKSVPVVVKTKFLSGLIDDAVNGFENKGFAAAAQLQRVSKLVTELSQKAGQFDEVLAILDGLPPGEAKHSMATCLIALLICEEMKLNHGVAHEKLTMASLLHDVGLKFVPAHILEKPRHQWTAEELSIYEQHPIRGVEVLREIKEISNDVLLMIVEHHENSQGTGFPKRLRDVKISPLGKILGVANQFSNLIFAGSDTGRNFTADEALDYIENILGQPYNKQVFQALRNLVNRDYLKGRRAKGS